MEKCKVGIVTFGHSELNQIVNTRKVQEDLISKIKKWPLDLYIAKDIPFLPRDLSKILSYLNRNEVDVVIFYLVSYCAEGLPLALAAQLNCPIILWSVNKSNLTSLSLLSIIANSRNMKHLNKNYFYVIGKPESNNTKEKIIELCKTAFLGKILYKRTIGVIGNYNPGQVDTIVNEFQLRKIVPGILYLDTLELVKIYKEIKDLEAKILINKKISQIQINGVSEAVLIKAMKWYLAMKEMVNKYKLDAITLRSWPELTNYEGFDRGINASLLNEEGIVCIQEVDISATITALILQQLTGSPVFCGEIKSLEKDSFILFHIGEAAFSLSKSLKDISFYPVTSNSTVDLQITLRAGEITIAKITALPLGKSPKMLISKGKVLESIDLVHRRAGALVQPDIEASSFVDKLIEEGIEHHLIIAYGDVTQELCDFCNLKGIEKIII